MKKTLIRLLAVFACLLAALAVTAAAYTVSLDDNGSVTVKTGTDGASLDVPHDTFKGTDALLGWQTADGAFLAGTSFFPTGEITLYARYQSTAAPTPGVNAVTNGDFEGTGVDVRPSSGYVEIVEDPLDPTNHVLYYYRTGGYSSIQHSVAWETGRPYYIACRFMSAYGVTHAINVRYASDASGNDHIQRQFYTNADEWQEASVTYTHTNASHRPGYTTDFLSFYANPNNGKPCEVYYDDLVIIPYVKISFDANGGSGAPESAYQLSGIYNVPDTVPTRFGYDFLGWTAADDPETPVTSVALGEGDVTLTALWQKAENLEPLTYAAKDSTKGIADGTVYFALPASTASASLYFADENGDPVGEKLADVTLSDGVGSYVIENYTFIPKTASKFLAVSGDASYTAAVPAEKRAPDTCILVYEDGDTVTVREAAPGTRTYTPKDAAVADGKLLLGYANADGTEIHGYSLFPKSDLHLYAVWRDLETTVRSGENLFANGDFEGEGFDTLISNGSGCIVTEADGNRVLRYERGSGYASIQIPVAWDSTRPYKLHYRVKLAPTVPAYFNPIYGSANHATHVGTPTTDDWITVDRTFTAPEITPNASGDRVSLYTNPVPSGTENVVYYDDLTFIPYNKVTYDAAGGSGAPESAFFLGDYTVSGTVPVRRGYRFLGWTLYPDSVETVKTLSNVKGDVTLYAVWEETDAQNILTYTYATEQRGIADGTVTLILPADAPAYTNVTLRYADNFGVLEGYTPLAELALSDGAAAFAITGHHVFPRGATRLFADVTGDGLESARYTYTIPEERRFDGTQTPRFTYYQVSDPHCGGDYWLNGRNRAQAAADILAHDPDFVVIAGDLVNNSVESNFAALDTFLDTHFNNNGVPVFIVNGNHEFHISDTPSENYDRTDLLAAYDKQIAIDRSYGYDIRRNGDDLFYAATIEGAKFIFLAMPSPIRTYTLTDEQLRFLDNELYEAEKSNETVFVVSHVGVQARIPHGEPGIGNVKAFEDILARHPNVVFACGHTHSNLTENLAGAELQYVNVGDQTAAYTHLNDGCMVWLGGLDGEQYEKNFSAGVRVEVYDDKIVLELRKFDAESLAVAYGLYQVDIPGAGKTLPNVTVEGDRPAPGTTLSVKADGADVPDSYRVEWTVGRDGTVLCTDKTFTLPASDAFCNEYVHVRLIDADGDFASASSAEPFVSIPVTYDANNGTGETRTFYTLGGDYRPLTDTFFPKNGGKFFLGWSTDPAATKPLTVVPGVAEALTLYAVYSDKPVLTFDANVSGFERNFYVDSSEINDGVWHVESAAGDMYFTLSGVSFNADDYPYMRIKAKYTSGYGDGMFFNTTQTAFAAARRISLTGHGTNVASVDGFTVTEYNAKALFPNDWTGNVTMLRYDVIASGGVVDVDYVVFTDKKGVYGASVTTGGGTPALESGEHIASIDAKREGYEWRITLIPEAGYEFTTPEDVLATVTVDGASPEAATVHEDGSATVTVTDENAVPASYAEVRDLAVTGLVAADRRGAAQASAVLAVTDPAGRLLAAHTVTLAADSVTVQPFTLTVASPVGAVRLYTFESLDSLKPAGAPQTLYTAPSPDADVDVDPLYH